MAKAPKTIAPAAKSRSVRAMGEPPVETRSADSSAAQKTNRAQPCTFVRRSESSVSERKSYAVTHFSIPLVLISLAKNKDLSSFPAGPRFAERVASTQFTVRTVRRSLDVCAIAIRSAERSPTIELSVTQPGRDAHGRSISTLDERRACGFGCWILVVRICDCQSEGADGHERARSGARCQRRVRRKRSWSARRRCRRRKPCRGTLGSGARVFLQFTRRVFRFRGGQPRSRTQNEPGQLQGMSRAAGSWRNESGAESAGGLRDSGQRLRQRAGVPHVEWAGARSEVREKRRRDA